MTTRMIPAPVASLVQALRVRLQVAEAAVLDCLDLVDDAIQQQAWTFYGYVDPAPWFADVLGVRYDSLRRRLRVLDGLRALPAADVEIAREAVAEMGATKAGIFAAILRDDRTRAAWNQHLPRPEESVERYQERVSALLELQPRGSSTDPGETWRRRFLALLPDEHAERAEAVLKAYMRVAGLSHPLPAFVHWIEVAEADLSAQGITL